MMDRNEVKLLILFLAVAANSGVIACEYGPNDPSIVLCCDEYYRWNSTKIGSCHELEIKDQCDVAKCCHTAYPAEYPASLLSNDVYKDDLDNYLACIKEAADNGCPGQTLYGPPSDQ